MSNKVQAVPVRDFLSFKPLDLLNGLKVGHKVVFEDNIVVDMSYKEIVINRYIWDLITLVPEIAIVSKYNITTHYTNNMYTSKSINKCFETIIKDMINMILIPGNNIKFLEDIYKHMYLITNTIYNEVVYANIDYATSINIIDLLDIQMDPELISAMKEVDVLKTVESVEKTYDILDRNIRHNPELRDNDIAKAYISGQVNPNQIRQVLASRGHATEIDGSIFKYPIASSFTLGMKDMYDMAIESRSGAKALHLSNKAIQDSEYFARELQLVTMVVEKLEHTDCGNNDYIDWYVRPGEDTISGKSDLGNMIGKRYLNEDGKEEFITNDHQHLVGTTVKLRSVMKCRLKNKHNICSACLGELSYGFHEHSNVGHLSATTLTQKLTQSILSTKHLTTSATTGSVSLDENAKKFFVVKEKDGYAFKTGILSRAKSKLSLIVSQEQSFGLKDLLNGKDISKLDPSRISRIESMIIVVDTKGSKEYFPIIVKDGNKRGSFTYKFLEYIIEAGYTLDSQDRYVIDLSGWKYVSPIIKLPQVEFSFMVLAAEIKSILKSIKLHRGMRSKESQESLLQKLFDLANSKLDVNIALLEVIIYAFSVVSIEDDNYGLARGAPDPQMASILSNIVNRSMGPTYAYQTVTKQIVSPKSFKATHKTDHLLDIMIKPNDVLMAHYGKL